ncbi:hypothetical protein KSF73_12440 [Burkholderiaceae bacterium DAT-1]|nr:hypothetical protein [Burkholderiaceae bacterium DAT-1]
MRNRWNGWPGANAWQCMLMACLLLGLGQSVCAEDKRTLKLTTFTNGESTTVPAKIILSRAYRALGIEISVVAWPGWRSLHDAEHGIYDGELVRNEQIDPRFRHLRKVPVSLGEYGYFMFTSKKLKQDVSDWEKLFYSRLRIAAPFGSRYAEKTLGEAITKPVADGHSGLVLLWRDQVDVVVMSSKELDGALAATKAAGIDPDQFVKRPLGGMAGMYHYVHERNADLIPKLSKQLQKMQDSGEIRQIWQDYAKAHPRQ